MAAPHTRPTLPPPPPAPPGERVESAARPVTPALHSPCHGGRPRRNIALLSLRRSGERMMHGPCYIGTQLSRAGYHTRKSLSAAPRAFLPLRHDTLEVEGYPRNRRRPPVVPAEHGDAVAHPRVVHDPLGLVDDPVDALAGLWRGARRNSSKQGCKAKRRHSSAWCFDNTAQARATAWEQRDAERPSAQRRDRHSHRT
eukprot:228299-Chlamydomonas_euryale.AAC.1